MLHHTQHDQLSEDTAQTKGMRRYEAISGKRNGSRKIWMGKNHVGPNMKSQDHHHGEAETGIYIVSGHPVFVFLEDGEERRVETSPGDYIYVPPYVPHREENPSPDEEAVVVLARSTQEGIVVNLPSLRAEVPELDAADRRAGGRGLGLVPRPLRVGVQLPEVERVVRWPEYLAIARAAEEVGFDSIWLGDHLLYVDQSGSDRGPWDAFTMLAALAVATERVTLGPLVACLAFHPPGMIARMAAAIDEISGGRFVLGVGSGWNETEFRAFGFPFDHLASRFLESFEIVRRLLDGERVSLEGEYWEVEDAVLLPSPARRVPLMLGSRGPRQLAATLPYVDSWNTWYTGFGNTAAGFATLNDVISEAAGEAGREPSEIERSACVLVAFQSRSIERPHTEEGPPLVGDAEHMARELRAYAEAGADELILVLDPITGETVRRCARVLELLDG